MLHTQVSSSAMRRKLRGREIVGGTRGGGGAFIGKNGMGHCPQTCNRSIRAVREPFPRPAALEDAQSKNSVRSETLSKGHRGDNSDDSFWLEQQLEAVAELMVLEATALGRPT